MNSPVIVGFNNQEILCFKDSNNDVFVSIRRMCENIGLTRQQQQKKIENDPKYVWNLMVLHDASGRKQKMFCIKLDNVQGWLLSINANKVKPEVRPRLLKYQQECMKVLNDYWTKGVAVNPRAVESLPALPTLDIHALVEQIKEALTPLIKSLVSGLHKQSLLQLADQESKLRTDHSKRVVEALKPIAVSGVPEYSHWAFTQIRNLVEEDLNPYSYFKLYEIFTAINPALTKEEAQSLASQFRKLEEVQEYERGRVVENYGDRSYMVKRYERRDWDDLRDLAITWLRERKYGAGQTGLFSNAGGGQ
jgi:hypothetical protein